MSRLPEVERITNSAAFGTLVQSLATLVSEAMGSDTDFAKTEAVGLQLAEEAVRQVLERDMRARAERLDSAEKIHVEGKIYRRHESGLGKYPSLTGVLEVVRHTFRLVGVHNGPTIVPLELEAGIVEGATPALAYNVALAYGKDDMRSHGEDLEAAHRTPPSRTTLENLAKRIGREVKRKIPVIEPIVRAAEMVPAEAIAVSAGLDRTATPMEELRPEGQAPNTRRKKRTKPYVRKPPPPIDINHRMSYVGSVSLVGLDGEITTRKYAATANEGPDQVAARMRADLAAYLAQRPDLHLGIVQDGAPEMWNVMRPMIESLQVKNWSETIDRFHLDERLAEALNLLPLDDITRARFKKQWKIDLDENDDAIEQIEHTLITWASSGGMSAAAAKKIDEHLTYIKNNKARMRYASMRAKGLPIGSGATEGSCKSVVGRRCKRGGEHWKDDGLSSVLTLRALHLSERLPQFWTRFAAGYVHEVEVAA